MTRTLAIDVGTSSVKAAVILDGAVVASVDHAYPLASPAPGWVEQDPDDWWDGTVATICPTDPRTRTSLTSTRSPSPGRCKT